VARDQLYVPAFELLGFKPKENKSAASDHLKPDYLLKGKNKKTATAAFVYSWDRWLDGPDLNDRETPDENPGACVVSALDDGVADWVIVTNGRLWRLYSRRAHSRATNFYEVDLVEALAASGETDPNEAFRYWWLFFRLAAFEPLDGEPAACWLDNVVQGSRDYAKRLGERLKDRVFETIFPHLAQGFIVDRRRRLGSRAKFTDEELADIFEATLTLLYRLLFLLYAESRDLLPIREAPYYSASLKKIKEEIAQQAGGAESQAAERLRKAYAEKEYGLYERLSGLCAAMDHGDAALNVPIYNGGLFITEPDDSDGREERIARFLLEHKVPDRYLALAVDRLARDQDEKTLSLVFIDYKSLVRHLGSIYEGLLEFKLKIAEEDLTTKKEKKRERYIALSKAKPKRGKAPEVVVRKGEYYLSNDKAERKATGSYYTPDPIVEYIVEQTVGPVLGEKLEALRLRFRKVRKTFNRELDKAKAYPVKKPSGETWDAREFALEKVYAEHKGLFEDLFEFRTLDPAMGSGHFLVEAVDFITDRVLGFLNQFPINPVSVALDRTRKNILEALGEQGVSVDAAKLTEVNLLKRHVLKRCIYGVDINPMAVELAKVSLWLDAFTLGAPLSFLDHHLRCGNSLVGATFEDLDLLMRNTKQATLFGIDYEPLLRAIRHVLQVNKMADATAAEVKQSAGEYTAARRDLSGYQIVLDLLVAGHFGLPDAPELLQMGAELDLTSRDQFMDSVAALGVGKKGKQSATDVVAEVETLACRPDLRFFHWEIEFPEVFFGFEDANQRRLKHKDKILVGSAGFEAVVGNPPYYLLQGRLEQRILESLHPSFHSGSDDVLYYFVKLQVQILRGSARGAYILSRYWMESQHAENLRQFLADNCEVRDLVDFRNFQPFGKDVHILCCIPSIEKRRDGALTNVIRFEDFFSGDLPEVSVALSQAEAFDPCTPREVCKFSVRQGSFGKGPWFVSPHEVESLLERMQIESVPLGAVVQYTQGIKTGLNKAFIVPEDYARQECLEEDLLLPVAKGKDVLPFFIEDDTHFLIYTHTDVSIDDFPNIRHHLERFRQELAARAECNKGLYPWWRLQRPRDPKIVLAPKILTPLYATHNRFGLSVVRPYAVGVTDTCAFALDPSSTLSLEYVAGILNSPVAQFYHKRRAKLKRASYYEYFVDVLDHFPIPLPSRNPEAASAIEDCVGQLVDGKRRSEAAASQDKLEDYSFSLYGFTSDERLLIKRLAAIGCKTR